MFTPIKNFITYIQKNATSNAIFGGNSVIGGTTKMETENIKEETLSAGDMQNKNINLKETDKEIELDVTKEKEEKDVCELSKDSHSCLEDAEANAANIKKSSEPTENPSDFEDEDIEAQIESSIMLKKPIKGVSSNNSEILELKKSSNANCSIVISHDYNPNQHLCPTDDELEDFRHDPMEMLGTTSTPCSNQHVDEFCSVGSAEECFERDFRTVNDFPTEDEEEDNKTAYEDKEVVYSDIEGEEEKDLETEPEQNNAFSVEDEEEPFVDLDNFTNNNVIALEEVDLNASTVSIDTNNTTDDPLEIACEEREAFSSDKAAVLEELNLLNTSQTSQDDDTQTTTDEDLRWLKPDSEDNQPSCSSKLILKDSTTEVMPEKEERNGEGSDSGLGSEALHTTTISILDTSQLSRTNVTPAHTQIKAQNSEIILRSNVLRVAKSPPKGPPKPYRSNLKRRLEVEVDVTEGLGSHTSTVTSISNSSCLDGNIQKKPKRSINFDSVQVYYFPRQQGFSCVPSAGGCTLGMGSRHVAFKTLTLAEHAAELRRAHRMQLQEINPRGSSSDESEESEEDYLSEGSGSDLDGESNGFLQPVSPKQRRALLKAAGIRKIDPSEKAECRNIRNSREVCGCTCRDFCDPETCACSQSGIKCQVDRDMFPCGCSRDACGNTIGRVEFNPTRVRTHYIHTLMRLEMENRQQQNPYSAVVSPMQPTPSSYYQAHLQPQSNYSSGYASPAYNTASEIHHPTTAGSYYHTQNTSTSNSLYGQQTSLEMTHNGSGSVTAVTSPYGIDSMDTSLFGGTTATAPSYGELMPLTSYHYENVQTQASSYNAYHNTAYINTNNSTNSLNTSNTYSSCAVPSIPPFGTATTTDAAGIYHSVSSLSSLETTTAPSCNVNGAPQLESDTSSSFISLSTPMASSSRLLRINDLLQHNRNAATALVAVTQNIETTDNKSDSTTCLTQANSNNLHTDSSTLCSVEDAPHIEDTHKSCMVFEELVSTLKPAASAIGTCDEQQSESEEITALTSPAVVAETLTKNVEDVSSLLSTEFLSREDDKSTTTVSVTIEPSTIQVAAGN